jgi:hypothetical protein
VRTPTRLCPIAETHTLQSMCTREPAPQSNKIYDLLVTFIRANWYRKHLTIYSINNASSLSLSLLVHISERIHFLFVICKLFNDCDSLCMLCLRWSDSAS